MKVYSVYDSEFKKYGRVVDGMDDVCKGLVKGLSKTTLPEKGTGYVPTDPLLQNLPEAKEISDHCFGGMPVELGWCNGRNTKLNCLEYHRDSEFNLGTEDFILLLALKDEIEDWVLDTSKVKAFKVPAGVLVEVYATTLHYAPCHCDEEKGFRVMVALPWLTNTERPKMKNANHEDSLMTARNKWLLAHPESPEAAGGAVVGLKGENIDISL